MRSCEEPSVPPVAAPSVLDVPVGLQADGVEPATDSKDALRTRFAPSCAAPSVATRTLNENAEPNQLRSLAIGRNVSVYRPDATAPGSSLNANSATSPGDTFESPPLTSLLTYAGRALLIQDASANALARSAGL